MSCEKCKNITENSSPIYWFDSEYDDEPKEENIVFFLSCGDYYYDSWINYCPYCGEKLRWEVNKEEK